jgi:hypothetical protein
MANRFLGYNIALVITFLLLGAATALLFVAAGNLTVTNTATTNATIVANNKTAQGALYGAAVSAIIATLILLAMAIYFWATSSRRDVELVTLTSQAAIEAAQLGWIYYFALFLSWILTLVAIGVGIYGITFIDNSTNNTGGSTAKSMAIIGIVLAILGFFGLLYLIYETWAYNRYIGNPTVVSKESIEGPVALRTNDKTFNGEVHIKGSVHAAPVYYDVGDGKVLTKNAADISINNTILYTNGVASAADEKKLVNINQPQMNQNNLRRQRERERELRLRREQEKLRVNANEVQ